MVLELINEHLDKKLGTSRERLSHYASDISACVRKRWYNFMKVEKTEPYRNDMALEMGNKSEEIVRDALDRAVEEKKIKGYYSQPAFSYSLDGLEYPISMRLDFVIINDNMEQVGVEIKSSYGRYISNIQKTGMPKLEHLYQVATYLYFTPIKEFRIVLLGRDSGYRTEFKVKLPHDHELGELCMLQVYKGDSGLYQEVKLEYPEMVRRLYELEDHLPSHENKWLGVVPPRKTGAAVCIRDGLIVDKYQQNGVQYTPDDECKWCNWRSHCFKESIEKYKKGYNTEELNA